MAIIYLHIGAPKTATSTLQGVLAKNYDRLLQQGVLYPRDMRNGDAHHLLVCDLIEKYGGKPMPAIWYGSQPRGQAWSALVEEINRHGDAIDSVILSSELFFGQMENIDVMLEDIATYLHGHEVRVLVYLRRQDQLYSSFYNQDVKGVRQWSHSAYQFYQTHQIFQQDYHQLLDVWSGAFGKKHVIIRPFEPGQWPDGDIVQDFCVAVGASPLRAQSRDNDDSLEMVQLYLKQCLNKMGFDKDQNERVLKILVKVCPEGPTKRCQYVHRGLYRQYRERWQRDNLALSCDYLEGASLFQAPIPEPEDIELYKINRMDVAGYAKYMFEKFAKGKYREHRQLFARATVLMLTEQDLWHALQPDQRDTLLDWALRSSD
jgi:hypothetical protein